MSTQQKPQKPLPPSVAQVFEEFLKGLENDDAIGPDVAKSLRSALIENQRFDAETLSEAMKVDDEKVP